MAVLLLFFAIGTAWFSPRVLTLGRWQVRRPRLALSLWHIAFLCGLLSAAAAVVAAVVATLTVTAGAGQFAVVISVAGWAALAAVGGAGTLVVAGGDDVADASRRNRGAVLALPHTARLLDTRTELRVCRSDEVFACSIPCARGIVVVTTSLVSLLTPAQLHAVVAHEKAHLRQHHHLAQRLADLNIACLPRNAATRRLRGATALLIELIADDDAAHKAGAVHLANALARLAKETGDAYMDLRAERLTHRRWRSSSRPASLPPVYSSVGRACTADA
ncbi:M56 family metallopeptidase [Microbacterium horticulturae]|uniref:M56 family metallopeptidase n=1 Tax=Microbacterium horticulturae TaxID=3028316 RepID=A0ABY8C204_9MICO|nr:M56 family metallopeptidase [Microbacterium sp. KACC 23027]WEG08658.1 M56 family metallopeptidase [Microbacterium sp. KACC 23027]